MNVPSPPSPEPVPPSLWFVRPRRGCVRCVGSDVQDVLSIEGIEASARRAGGLEVSAGAEAVGRAQARFGQDWIFEPVLAAAGPRGFGL